MTKKARVEGKINKKKGLKVKREVCIQLKEGEELRKTCKTNHQVISKSYWLIIC